MTDTQKADPFAVLAAKKATEVKVAICTDDALVADVDAARRARDQATFDHDAGTGTPAELKQAEKALSKAEDALNARTVVFTFRSVGPNPWDQLIANHPPTKEQVAEAAKRGGWLQFNPETFPPAAISAACADPVLPAETVQGWFADPAWSKADTDALFEAATVVNLTPSTVDLGKGSGSTRN